MKGVQILLSTYNGCRYLEALLESLSRQDYPAVRILVRDDGSTDRTPDLLSAYAKTHSKVEIVFGENIGFARSFLELIGLADPDAHYYALCDQDDIWKPDKVSRAVRFVNRCTADVPALYCSRLTVVSEELKQLGHSDIPMKELSFCNALVENQVRGCTTLFNRAARRLLTRAPAACISHDWWIYLVVSAFGEVIYDSECRILYRQHGSNVFGISTGPMAAWTNKIRQFSRDGGCNLVEKQAEEFRLVHGASLAEEHRRVLDRFLEKKRFWGRLCYALSCDVYRQSPRDQYILKARLALGI